MFKKLFLTSLAFMLIAQIAFAGVANKTIISQTLDDDPTSVTSSAFNIQDYSRVAFWVKYDETQVVGSVQAAVSLDISYDGTNWITGASFFDLAGGISTLQTSETIIADGWYFMWLDPDWQIPYVRMVVAGTNTTANDTIAITAYLVGVK